MPMPQCTEAEHAALLTLKSDPAWLRAHSSPRGLMRDVVTDEQRVDIYEHRNHKCRCGRTFTWCLLVSSVAL